MSHCFQWLVFKSSNGRSSLPSFFCYLVVEILWFFLFFFFRTIGSWRMIYFYGKISLPLYLWKSLYFFYFLTYQGYLGVMVLTISFRSLFSWRKSTFTLRCRFLLLVIFTIVMIMYVWKKNKFLFLGGIFYQRRNLFLFLLRHILNTTYIFSFCLLSMSYSCLLLLYFRIITFRKIMYTHFFSCRSFIPHHYMWTSWSIKWPTPSS